MTRFLSCDWGTSAFRLRLVTVPDLSIVAEGVSTMGIMSCYEEWKKTNETNAETRILFYIETLSKHIQNIENRLSLDLDGIPVVISGMASSSIGMMELPYGKLPFDASGESAQVHIIKASTAFAHTIFLVSGLRTEDDVMRGEETQWLGAVAESTATDFTQLYIFPGTHSKHLLIKNNTIIDFKTYMTGEFFDLLSKKSILQAAVEHSTGWDEEEKTESFRKGVRDASATNLLHASFKVRTNDLFRTLSKKQNYSYLSGLLIGMEISDISKDNAHQIWLCCSQQLIKPYELALQELGFIERTSIFPSDQFDSTVVKGQYKILVHRNE